MPRRRRAKLVYPFARMNAGDSFIVPRVDTQRTRMAAQYYAAQHRVALYVAKCDDGKYRCFCLGQTA